MTHIDDASQRTISEEAARALLARAIDLDLQRGDQLSLAEVRAIAAEAGISPEALTLALADPTADHPALPVARSAPWQALLRNALPFATACIALTALAGFWGAANLSWLLRSAITPVALLAGVYAAIHLKAKPARMILTGFAIATGAEFLMDLAFGVPALRGSGAHLSLLGAAVVGVWVGSRLGRERTVPPEAPKAAGAMRHAAPDAPTPSPVRGDTLTFAPNAP